MHVLPIAYDTLPRIKYIVINYQVYFPLLTLKLWTIDRQKETLEKMMDAAGYKEKVKAHVHEENVAKLTKLMQEVLSLEEASEHLERDIAVQAASNNND